MKIISHRFLFLVFFLSNVVCADMPLQETSEAYQEDRVTAFQEEPPEFDIEKTMQLICRIQKEWLAKQQRHRQNMLQQLPEEAQEAIQEAEKAYMNVINLLNISYIARDKAILLLKDCEQLKIEDEKVFYYFDKLFLAIEQGSFDKLLYGGASHDYLAAGFSPEKLLQDENTFDFDGLMGALTGKKKTFEDALSREELGDLIERLKKVRMTYEYDEPKVAFSLWDECLDLLECIYEQKVYKAALKAFDQLKPRVQTARTAITTALQFVKKGNDACCLTEEKNTINEEGEGFFAGDQVADLTQEAEAASETPCSFWEKQLYGYKRKMNSLYWLTAGVATDSFELSELLFKCTSYAHSIGQQFLHLYEKDIYTFPPTLQFSQTRTPLDVELFVVRPVLGLWNFFNMRSQLIGQIASLTLSGQIPHDQIDYPQLLTLNAIIVPLSMKTLPYLYGEYKSKTEKIFEKISVAWIYYHIFHCHSFGREDSGFDHPDTGTFWPRNYRYMIDAVSYGLREGQEYCGHKIAQSVALSMNPETLDSLENYSLGVIKPELIPFLVRVAFPLVAHNVLSEDYAIPYGDGEQLSISLKNLVNLRPIGHEHAPLGDLYNWTSWMNVPSWMQGAVMRWTYALTESSAIRRSAHLQKFYVESQVYFYLLSSIGGFCGGHIAVKYHDHVASGLKSLTQRCVSLGGTLGIFSDDVVHEVNDSLVEGFSLMIEQLREGLLSFFIVSSKARGMAKSYLINKERLSGSETNELVISGEILAAMLTLLTQARLLKYSQSISIIQKFKECSDNVEAVVDSLIGCLLENGIRFVGESLGSSTAQLAGGVVWHKYGPFISPRNDS